MSYPWACAAVEKMVSVYAHAEIGALDAIDAAFASLPHTNQAPLGDGSAQLGTVDDVPTTELGFGGGNKAPTPT